MFWQCVPSTIFLARQLTPSRFSKTTPGQGVSGQGSAKPAHFRQRNFASDADFSCIEREYPYSAFANSCDARLQEGKRKAPMEDAT
jgi:hypothetical protein